MLNKISTLALGSLLAVQVAQAGDGGHDANHAHMHKAHWTYAGEGAPQHWGELSPEFAQCSQGKKQSPIDIRVDQAKSEKLAPIQFNYKKAATKLVNNGHTIKVDYAPGSTITVGKKTYDLLQFHFHSPSEHKINGKPFDMVAHLVHKAKDGQLGVIAVMLKANGNNHQLINRIWSKMPKTQGETAGNTLDVAALLPKNKAYYNYVGSLTTPPCSEGVNWMVLKTPVSVSSQQVQQFSQLFPKSVRPTQALNGRITKLSQ